MNTLTRNTSPVILQALRPASRSSFPLSKRRRWYDDTGDGDDTTEGNDNNSNDDKGNDKSQRTFTQADVDRIVQERLARAKPDASAVEADLVKRLGVDNFDAAKSLIEMARQTEQEQLTELEQARQALESTQSKLAEAQTEAQTARATLIQERRNTALSSALSEAGVISVRPAVLAVLDSGVELVNEEGVVDDDAIKAAVDKLKEDEPVLFKAPEPKKGLDSLKDKLNVTPDADRAKKAAERMDRTIRHQR